LRRGQTSDWRKGETNLNKKGGKKRGDIENAPENKAKEEQQADHNGETYCG
jgi:hypothetical protein